MKILASIFVAVYFGFYMNISIARQWEVLRIIPKYPNFITSRELNDRLSACGFESSKRTIERDLRDLSKIFPLVSDENSQPYKWYWLRDMAQEFGGISLDEAISLSLADDALRDILPNSIFSSIKQNFSLSNKKIRNLSALSVSKLRTKFRYITQSLPLKKVSLPKNIIDKVKLALLEDRQIKLSYDPNLKATKDNILNPLGFVQLGLRPYLIATVVGVDEKILALALQRIRKIEVLAEKLEVPVGFSLDTYIASDAMQFGLCKDIKFKAIVTESLAVYLQETPISADQKISYIDNTWRLSASVKDTWSLYFWIRSQGSEITVLSPKRIRDKLLVDLKKLNENYNKVF